MPPLVAPAPARVYTPPTPFVNVLPNGLRVLVIERRGTGRITIQATMRAAGSDRDGAFPGLARMTAKLLVRGTETRDSTQIAARIEKIGGTLTADASRDCATVRLSTLSSQAEMTVETLADIVRRPTFLAVEIEKRRLQMLDDLTLAVGQPETLARLAVGRIIFGSGNYGSDPLGTPEGVTRARKEEIIRFHVAAYRPNLTSVVICGDIAPSTAFALAQKHWGKWRGSDRVPAHSAPSDNPIPPLRRRIMILDTPDAVQAAVFLVRPGVRRSDADFARSLVADALLSRALAASDPAVNGPFFASPRSSVTVETELLRRSAIVSLSATTANNNAAVVAQALLERLKTLAAESPRPAELAAARARVQRDLLARLQTTEGVAELYGTLEAQGVTPNHYAALLGFIEAVTGDGVRAAARERLAADGASVLIVGDQPKFLADLKRRFPGIGIETVPVERLDLNRGSLFREADDAVEMPAGSDQP